HRRRRQPLSTTQRSLRRFEPPQRHRAQNRDFSSSARSRRVRRSPSRRLYPRRHKPHRGAGLTPHHPEEPINQLVSSITYSVTTSAREFENAFVSPTTAKPRRLNTFCEPILSTGTRARIGRASNSAKNASTALVVIP